MTTQPMPSPGSRDPGDEFRSDHRMIVDAPRLWAGGAATAVVAGLVAFVGVLIAADILKFKISMAAVILSVFDSFTSNYVLTGVLLALAGTGLAHALCVSTPRPAAFFSWIVGLLTVIGVVIPFTRGGTMTDKISVGVINLIIGVVIGSLISAVMARTVVDRGTRVPPRR